MSKNLLDLKRQEKAEKEQKKRESAPWWRENTKRIKSELITATPKEKKEYMKEGKLPPNRNKKKDE